MPNRVVRNPDETVDHRPDVCPECHGHLEADLAGDVIGEYDEIEVPLIKPFVRRHRRLCVWCPHCSSKVKARFPEAAHGSPFGPRLHGLVLYLKTFQAFVPENGSLDRFPGPLDQSVLTICAIGRHVERFVRRQNQPGCAGEYAETLAQAICSQESSHLKDLRRTDIVACSLMFRD